MSTWDVYSGVWKNATQFSGRAGRREYWVFTLINMAIYIVPSLVVGLVSGATGSVSETVSMLVVIPSTLFLLAAILPSLAVTVRRLHDRNLSGWVLFVALVPLLGALFLLVTYLLPSNEGENRFGPQPGTDAHFSEAVLTP